MSVVITTGEIEIKSDLHAVPEADVVHIDDDVARNLCNRTGKSTQVWLAFGAPLGGLR